MGVSACLIENKKNAKCYYVKLRWCDKCGNQKQQMVSTKIPLKGSNKRKAKLAAEEIRCLKEDELSALPVSVREFTFDQYLLQWLHAQKRLVKPSTYYGYSNIIENRIIPYFKPLHIKLNKLSAADIQLYYNKLLDEGLSPNTVKRHHANIRKSLQEALIQGVIACNVADLTKLPMAKKYNAAIYDSSQLKNLLKIVNGTSIESAIVLTVYYALRRGEVCGLKWSDIDWDNRLIHIRNTRTTARAEVYQNNTKNTSSTRDLPLDDHMITYLTKLRYKQAEDKLFYGKNYTDSGFICRWDDGKELKVSYLSHKLSELLEKNNMPHIRLHDIRHSTATSLLNSGIDLKVIQEFLGHSSINTTANFYLHPEMEKKREAVNAISSAVLGKTLVG